MTPIETLALTTVVHGDAREPGRLASGEAPTPLAPWHTWLLGRYRPCPDPATFRTALAQAQGPTIVVLHADDLRTVWGSAAAEWVSGPGDRWLILYSGGWRSWGACTLDEVARAIGPVLPAEAWHRRWTAMPWSDLSGTARPVAWLGHRGPGRVGLDRLSRRQPEWEQEACALLVGSLPLNGSEESVLEAVRADLREGLLRHHLNSDGAHPRSAEARLGGLVGDGDSLWALEGLAAGRGWVRLETLLAGVRGELERLFRGPLAGPLLALDDRDDHRANRLAWWPTVEAIQALLDRP